MFDHDTERRLPRRSFLALLAVGLVAGARVLRRAVRAEPAPVAMPPSTPIATRTVQIICRSAWGAQPAKKSLLREHTIKRITVHHSAVLLTDNRNAPARFRSHQQAHFSNGWGDIAYHILIDRNGNVYRGRPAWAKGDTATSYNPAGHLLVLCEGNFQSQGPSKAQVRALVNVLAWGCKRYGVRPKRIRGHLDFAATSCPGTRLYDRLPNVRRRVRRRLKAGGTKLVKLCGDAGKARVKAIEDGSA